MVVDIGIINERIKERRLACNYTLLDVANKLGVQEATVQRYESGEIKNIKNETILELSKMFKCSPMYLLGWDDSGQTRKDTTYFLDQKLAQIGYKIDGDPTEGYLWIEYPDGTLEVSQQDLQDLDMSSSSYLKFKLEELKEKNIKNFRKK